MIDRTEIAAIAKEYCGKASVACLGSHSALDIASGAKSEGLPSIVVCEKGRDATYSKYYKTRNGRGCIDEIVMTDKFKDVLMPATVEALRTKNAVFVPHRSFQVYVGYDGIENEFRVPIFGNRAMLRMEERTSVPNQYDLLRKAGIRTPRVYARPDEIDRLVIVKAPEAVRTYERAFFVVSSLADYKKTAEEMMKAGLVTREGVKNAVIEEFILGAQFNFNYFYSPLSGELELLGIDTRRQSNLDGLLRLPAPSQAAVLKRGTAVRNIEVGHIACTIRESLLDKVFAMGEAFVAASKEMAPPGIIGPFALQGAVIASEKGEEPVIFDVSPRVPGSPGTRFTPYTSYLYGESVSVGRRIAIELKEAAKQGRLEEVVT